MDDFYSVNLTKTLVATQETGPGRNSIASAGFSIVYTVEIHSG